MKIGILACGVNCENELDKVLSSWFLNSAFAPIIAAVSCPFIGFDIEDNSKTIEKLQEYKNSGQINYLYTQNEPVEEHVARNFAANYLLEQNVDFIWLLDLSDEYYTVSEIINIYNFINKPENKFYTWFKINFKNYVFDKTQWIDGFCPPRIFRVKGNNYVFDKMYYDNDVFYKDLITNDIKDYKNMSNIAIPKKLAHIRHETWQSDERGRKKAAYQERHFSTGCSYKWNEKENKLEFNKDFYLKTGQELPIINYD